MGSQENQFYDLTRAIFSPNSKLVIYDLAELILQVEKIQHITLCDTISFNLKRLIIDYLKDKSYKNNKKAQFELEYIFSKSTMFQEPGDEYIKNKWHQIWKWPKWFINTLYYITMGLGWGVTFNKL